MIPRRLMNNDKIVSEQVNEPTILDKCKGSYFNGMNVYGHSTQVTTTGAQLLNLKPEKLISTEGLIGVINQDGSLSVTGVPTTQYSRVYDEDAMYLPHGMYFVSDKTGSAEAGKVRLQINITRQDDNIEFITNSVCEFKQDDKSRTLLITHNSTDLKEVNQVLYPMLNEGSTVKPFEPYTGGNPSPSPEYKQEIVSAGQSGQIKTDVLGGNLLDLSQGKSGTGEGVTYTKNPNGSYRRTGTATGTAGNVWFLGRYALDPNIPENVLFTLKPGTYTTYGNVILSNKEAKRGTFTIDSDFKVTGVRNPSQELEKTYNDTIYPMLNVGSSALHFEPYKQPQTLILTTPDGLPGIPVSGDDYTYIDSAGQKWIADSIEYRRNGKCVRVQRITKETIVGGFSFAEMSDVPGRYIASNVLKHTYKDGYSKSMCNIAVWSSWGVEWGEVKTNNWFTLSKKAVYFTPKGNIADWNAEKVNNLFNGIPGGVTVLGQLENPIETDLTAEEIASYKSVHTYATNTTITSEPNVSMNVIYRKLRN